MTERVSTRDSASRAYACRRAVEVLRAGGVVVYPSDTTYALGVDALNESAVERLFQLKGRARGKPVHLTIASIDHAGRYAVLGDDARRLMDAFLPGPLTVVAPRTPVVPDVLVAGLPSVGIRIPDHDVCLEMVQAVGTAVTATSANLSGAPAAYSVEDLVEQLGEATEGVDLILDHGALPEVAPSTVVDVSGSPPRVLRDGPISREELRRILPTLV